MSIVQCDGDGNCLFRAVSHQLYGTQDHHAAIREATMSYMVCMVHPWACVGLPHVCACARVLRRVHVLAFFCVPPHLRARDTAGLWQEVWRSHFASFTVGSLDQFDEYIAWKRQLGVWGDDPEIQAMSEMYSRPVLVYAFHPVEGAVVLNRMAYSGGDVRPPIR